VLVEIIGSGVLLVVRFAAHGASREPKSTKPAHPHTHPSPQCGLNQLYAMRYGTVPIAHATGGLADTIDDVNPFGEGARFWFGLAWLRCIGLSWVLLECACVIVPKASTHQSSPHPRPNPPNTLPRPQTDEGTGWTFSPATAEALGDAVAAAVRCFRERPAGWKGVMERGMRVDHSWDDAAVKYERVLLGLQKQIAVRRV